MVERSYNTPTQPHGGLRVTGANWAAWCGPAALSAALGIQYGDAEKRLRMCGLRQSIKEVTYSDLAHVLTDAEVEFRTETYPRDPEACPRLRQWLNTRKEKGVMNRTHMICLTCHWIVVRGYHWACSMNPQGRELSASECPYWSSRVRHVITLTKS